MPGKRTLDQENAFSKILFGLNVLSWVTELFLVQEFFPIKVAAIFLQENGKLLGDFSIQLEVALPNGTYLEPSSSAC